MEINGSGLETELRLGLPGGGGDQAARKEKKRDFSDISGDGRAESKSQVVGWPPVAAFRRKNSFGGGGSKMYVKVSMDGAPFLRKIDLGSHKCYSDLVAAVEELFACGGIENNYCPIYEDKDGDWMLLGDVPWEMFVESCRRLRIMKGSDAEGIELEAKDLLKGLGEEEVENN